jgi:autotransporter-associated beta strand protein
VHYAGGAGGSGVVVLRYAGSPIAPGGTIDTTSVPGSTIHRFTTTGATTFAVNSADFRTTLSGNITGTGGFTLNRASTLVLTGSNTYSGDTIISAGVLQVGNGGSSGSLGSGGVTNNASLVFNRSDASSVANVISGSGSLTQAGVGTTTLLGANSYSGGTTVSAGRIIGTTASLQGAITNNAAVEFSQAASGTYSGNMGGSGSLTKTGVGTVTLTGSNTFSGGTTISAGTLAAALIADSGASNIGTSGTLALAGGTLRYTGATAASTARVVDVATNSTASAIEVVDPSATLTLSGKVWNSGTAHSNVVLNKTGAGTLEIAGAGGNAGLSLAARDGVALLASTTNAVYEIRALDAGATVRLQNNFQIFGGDAISTTGNIRMTGGTLDLNGFNETVNRVSGGDFSTAGTGTITSAAPATFTFGNNLAGRPSRFAGTITGSLSVAVKGTNPVTLSGNNTYDGTTTIQDAGTQLRIGVGGTSGSLGTGAAVNAGELLFDRSDAVAVSNAISGSGSLTQAGAGTLTLTGTNTYAGTTTISAGRLVGSTASLPGAIANASQLEFAQANAGTFAAAISGTGSFTKSGAGNLILAGTSSYTGATTVSAGRLSVNGALGNSPVMVLAAAELGGSGSIGGPVSVASGGTLSPGNSIASLAAGATSFASGATFEYEVDSTNLGALSTAADLLVANGNLDIASGSLLTFTDLNLTPNAFVDYTTIFALINYSGNWNGGLFTYNGTALADGSRFLVGDQQWEIDYNRTSPTGLANFTSDYLPESRFVAITAVPEPSALVLLGIGGVLACWAARRQKSRHPSAILKDTVIVVQIG